MIVITCGCAHSWVLPTMPASAWSRALQHDLCPACGHVGGPRFCSTFPDPNIRDVIATMEGCGRAPVAILARSVMEPKHNANLVLVTVQWRDAGKTMEMVCEVDRQARTITKTWLGEVIPYRTGLQRLPWWDTVRGILRDLIMTMACEQALVTDWQRWVDGAGGPG